MNANRIVGWLTAAALATTVLGACTPTPGEVDAGDAAAQAEATEEKDTDKPTETPEPTATDKPEPTATETAEESHDPGGKSLDGEQETDNQSAGPTIELTLENELDVPVCYVFVSPPSDETWGEDQLGSTEVIRAGAMRTFEVEAGEWDLMATDCDGETLAEEYGVDLSDDTTWTLSGSAAASSGGQSAGSGAILTLRNNSNTDVCWVYISPSTSSSWGSDWLGSDIAAAGSEFTFRLTPGEWDLLAQDCSGNTVAEEYQVAMEGSVTWTLTGSGGSQAVSPAVTLTMTNVSDIDICWVYISPSSSSDWGSDWLGSDIAYAGSEFAFRMAPGTYDLMAQDCNGSEVASEYGVNINASTQWTISGSGQVNSGSAGAPLNGADVPLRITNYGSSEVCYLYISSSNSSEWGGDWLGSDILYPNEYVEYWIPSGYYDVKATDCSNNTIAEDYSLAVDGTLDWEIYSGGGATSGGSTQQLTVYNGSSENLCYLYITPPSTDSWGDDRLGSSIIYAGNSMTFSLPAGTYDLKALRCDGSTLFETYYLDLYSSRTWEVFDDPQYSNSNHPNGDTVVTLALWNHTSEPVCYVWIGEPYSEWYGDLLGSDIIQGWETYYVDVNPGTWALQAEDCNGSVMYFTPSIDIYGYTEWHINP